MSEALPQRIVPFYGDELTAIQQPDGAIFVLFTRLCDNLGLARNSQLRRVQHHEILNEGFVTLSVQTEGGTQPVRCLRLDLLPLWMSGIHAKRVKPELQEKLVRYQREAATVLWQAFRPQIVVGDSAITPAQATQAITQLQQIAEMGRAITRLAEQQIELEQQQLALSMRLDGAARIMKGMQWQLADVDGRVADVDGRVVDVEIRLGVLEDRLHPASFITEAQAAEISNRVKALAELLSGSQGGKNFYQGIFQELYRRFGVASYKTIVQDQYAAVLAFLDDWQASVK